MNDQKYLTELDKRKSPVKSLHLFVFIVVCFYSSKPLAAQELYVFSEPASNMPAKALSLKYTGKFLEGYHSGKTEQRQSLAVQLGLNKKWMVRAATTISDMYSYPATRWESFNVYAKYRFLSRMKCISISGRQHLWRHLIAKMICTMMNFPWKETRAGYRPGLYLHSYCISSLYPQR